MDVSALDLRAADHAAAPADLFAWFYALVRRLRRDCPWDREQTHESVRLLTLEEAYETVEAIEAGDAGELKKELGDLLLHVLFHSVIAEEAGTFTLHDVLTTEFEKLVRRHPHVFGDTVVTGTGEVLQNWEAIKQAERAEEPMVRRSALDGVPDALPALLQAERVQEKAAALGFDFPDADEAWGKVEEELREVHEVVRGTREADRLEDEFGDLLFALVNVGRFVGVSPEGALRRTTRKFKRRFAYIEAALAARGTSPATTTLAEMDALWNEAKQAE